MKRLLLSTLWFVVRKLIGDEELINDIKDLVAEMMDFAVSGEEKRQRVRAKLSEIGHDLAAIGNSLVNLAIEAAVALAKNKLNR